MPETAELVFALEKAVHHLLAAAQGAVTEVGGAGEQVKALLFEAANSAAHAVDALRGAPGSRAGETGEEALHRLRTALDGLRPHLRRGTNAAEQLGLVRWLCDAALGALGRRPATPPG